MRKNKNLLSPYMLPNGVILKNRVTSAASTNNFVQATLADYPLNEMITMISKRAKNGATMITLTGTMEEGSIEFYHNIALAGGMSGADFFTLFDLKDIAKRTNFVEMTEAAHMHGSKILMQLIPLAPRDYDIVENSVLRFGSNEPDHYKEVTKEMLDGIRTRMIDWADYAQRCGFDGVLVHMCYGFSIAARMLSERYNTRTDEFGGSFENRISWPLSICSGIKEKCGKEFIVEAVISGNDPAENGNFR